MAELKKDQLHARKEVIIPISFSGLWKGLEQILVKAPLRAGAFITRKADDLSQVMMTGHLAIITMPVGIMLRNTARAMNNVVDLGNSRSRGIVAGASAIIGGAAGWWFAGNAVAGWLATTGFGVATGGVGTVIGAALLAAPAMIPAVGAAVLAGGLITGAVVGIASVIPAIANLGVALARTVDRWKGVKYSEKQLQDAQREFETKGSLSYDFERRQAEKTMSAIYSLSPEDRKTVYDSLKREFANVAEKQVAVNAPAAAPAGKNNPAL